LIREPTRPPLAPRFPPGGYLQSTTIPVDGWDNPYIYLTPGREDQPFELLSYGADGIEGGIGVNADISNLQ
jgi:general secretion pathway protein G